MVCVIVFLLCHVLLCCCHLFRVCLSVLFVNSYVVILCCCCACVFSLNAFMRFVCDVLCDGVCVVCVVVCVVLLFIKSMFVWFVWLIAMLYGLCLFVWFCRCCCVFVFMVSYAFKVCVLCLRFIVGCGVVCLRLG